MNPKNLVTSLVLALLANSVFGQYQPVEKNSRVTFKVKNLGFTVEGGFSGISGTIMFDPHNVTAASFAINVDAATVNTDNSLRDQHLRDVSYFDVKTYPKIYFTSTKVATTNRAGVLLLYGRLMIKNLSRDISFPFTATPLNGGYTFKGSFNVNRKDFNVGGTSIISDLVTIDLEIFAR